MSTPSLDLQYTNLSDRLLRMAYNIADADESMSSMLVVPHDYDILPYAKEVHGYLDSFRAIRKINVHEGAGNYVMEILHTRSLLSKVFVIRDSLRLPTLLGQRVNGVAIFYHTHPENWEYKQKAYILPVIMDRVIREFI